MMALGVTFTYNVASGAVFLYIFFKYGMVNELLNIGMNQFLEYTKTIEFLEGLSNIAPQRNYMTNHSHPDFYIKRMRYFLGLLGNPEKGPKYIHVTGTAGKGSVSAMIAQGLKASGKKVGLFTSPFVTTSVEKIWVDGLYIAPNELAKLVNNIKPVLDEMSQKSPYGMASYFEIFTALAFLYFKQQKCEWVVMEVGCGGRYDSTNVIPAPKAAVITNIGYDHTKILGKTLIKIAKDKAGIIKKGTRVYTTEKRANLIQIFKDECKKAGAVSFNKIMETTPQSPPSKGGEARQHSVGQIMETTPSHSASDFPDTLRKRSEQAGPGKPQSIPSPQPLSVSRRIGRGKKGGEEISRYRILNRNLAQAVLDDIDSSVKVKEIQLPCRFEVAQKKPLVILDGAHNAAKLSTTLLNLEKCDYKKLWLIVGFVDDKEFSNELDTLIQKSDHIISTRFQIKDRKAFPPHLLARELQKKTKKKVGSYLDPHSALEYVLGRMKSNDALLVTGSFFLAGELRKHWIPEHQILKRRKST